VYKDKVTEKNYCIVTRVGQPSQVMTLSDVDIMKLVVNEINKYEWSTATYDGTESNPMFTWKVNACNDEGPPEQDVLTIIGGEYEEVKAFYSR
jgi:hypothetical protein